VLRESSQELLGDIQYDLPRSEIIGGGFAGWAFSMARWIVFITSTTGTFCSRAISRIGRRSWGG
jgi:hypothetical protein